jgi:sugar-specific transcriptional regulator TrmB
MEQLIKWLKDFGLNDSEIRVYLAIVQYPHAKTNILQRETQLVRTTLYHTLSKLKAMGLVSENFQNNVRTYESNGPSILINQIEHDIQNSKKQLEQLNALQPLLTTPKNTKNKESSVARYEGVRAIKQSLEQAFRCESKHWYIIAPRDNFLAHADKSFQKYYLEERQRRGITAKTLWEQVPSNYKPSTEDIFYRNPRHLPDSFNGTFSSMVILYDDTTLVINSYAKKTAHAISDIENTHLMRLMFNAIWDNAKKL